MARMADFGVRRFVYTDISRDGTLTEPNFDAVAVMVERANALGAVLIASGGIRSIAHLERLAGLGAEAAIIGSAIYTGNIDLAQAVWALA
jgi:phosphoribosylformimino-5-aminoimidazole carboxamide ribotide isomerase